MGRWICVHLDSDPSCNFRSLREPWSQAKHRGQQGRSTRLCSRPPAQPRGSSEGCSSFASACAMKKDLHELFKLLALPPANPPAKDVPLAFKLTPLVLVCRCSAPIASRNWEDQRKHSTPRLLACDHHRAPRPANITLLCHRRFGFRMLPWETEHEGSR